MHIHIRNCSSNQGDQSLGFSELDEAKARARALANEESQAKQLIYLSEAPDAEKEERARTLYRKSHGSYLPGEILSLIISISILRYKTCRKIYTDSLLNQTYSDIVIGFKKPISEAASC